MAKKTLKKLDKKLSKLQKLERLLKLKKKSISRTIVKPSKQITVEIKKPVEAGTRAFKHEFEEAKKTLFFK